MVDRKADEVSRSIASIKTASRKQADLYRKWANPEVVQEIVKVAIPDWIKDIPGKIKRTLSEGLMEAWNSVRGKLEKFKKLFQRPKIIEALSEHIGEITPRSVKKFIKKGKKAAKKGLEKIRMFLTTESGLPTLSDLMARTAVGAKIGKWFHKNVKPSAKSLNDFLEEHLPTFRTAVSAAIFTFIWLNVDELSWEWSALYQGFTGGLPFHELIATFPESTIGFLSNIFFGIGYKIMPIMLGVRMLWLWKNNYLHYTNGEWNVNWNKVEKERFKDAERYESYGKLYVR